MANQSQTLSFPDPRRKPSTTFFRGEFYEPSILPVKLTCQTSAVGIDIYTHSVVELLAKLFSLSVRGQRSINTVLNNSPLFGTADEKLNFGWAIDHALKNADVHRWVYERLSLEVTLSEALPERYVAKVLWEMAGLHATDDDVTPHFREMVKLVNSSNGLFTLSDFALLVEGYLRMLPNSGSAAAADQGLPLPRAMALALETLAQVTRESDKQMTVVGGRILAWFVATAEWLFDLPTAIYLASGDHIYGKHDGQKTRVLLVFSSEPKLEAKLSSWTDDVAEARTVAAGSLSLSEQKVTPCVPFGGRVLWNSLLSQVFGQSFQHLEREETKTFGNLLGAIASALSDSIARHGRHYKHDHSRNRPVGATLVKLLTDWLPELRRLQGRMERQLKTTPEESRQTYIKSIETMQTACGCGLCGSGWNAETYRQIPPPYGYCLTVLVETIVVLGMVLSNLTVVAQLYPAAEGVRNLYRRQLAKRIEALQTKGGDQLAIADAVYEDEWDASELNRLQSCVELFSGSRPVTNTPENLVAISHEGICAYFVGMEGSRRVSRNGDQDLIRVITGGICVRFKAFSRAALGPVADADEINNVWEEVKCPHLSKPLYCM